MSTKECPLRIIANCVLGDKGLVNPICTEDRCAWWIMTEGIEKCALEDIADSLDAIAVNIKSGIETMRF